MSPAVRGLLVSGTGLVVTLAAKSGAYGAYLKPSMWLPLWATGLVMALVGVLALGEVAAGPLDAADGDGDGDDDAVRARDGAAGRDDTAPHEHRTPRVAALLVVPLLVAVVVRPPALGADAARRDAGAVTAMPAPARFAPLPPARDGAVDLLHSDFVARAAHDEAGNLAGVPLRLTGFVVRDPALEDGYVLTRFVMSCCAGDAMPVPVDVVGLGGPPPPDDTWLEVVGEWRPSDDPPSGDDRRNPTLSLATQREIDPPRFPYE